MGIILLCLICLIITRESSGCQGLHAPSRVCSSIAFSSSDGFSFRCLPCLPAAKHESSPLFQRRPQALVAPRPLFLDEVRRARSARLTSSFPLGGEGKRAWRCWDKWGGLINSRRRRWREAAEAKRENQTLCSIAAVSAIFLPPAVKTRGVVTDAAATALIDEWSRGTKGDAYLGATHSGMTARICC